MDARRPTRQLPEVKLSSVSRSEEDSLVAMLRFQEFERSTVDTEGAMGLAAILAGQLPELKGKK